MNIDTTGLDTEALAAWLEARLQADLASLVTALGIAAILGVALLLIGYILRSLAIARIGHRRGIPCWGLAWVPGLRLITIGQIADYHDKKTLYVKHGFAVLLPVLFFLGLIAGIAETALFSAQIKTALASISSSPETFLTALFSQSYAAAYTALSLIAVLSGTLFTVFYYIAIYKVLESCKRRRAFLTMILYVIVPFAGAIVLLAVSGHNSDKKHKSHRHHKEEKEAEVVTEAE